MVRKIRLSKSAIESFGFCAKSFEIKYIKKFKTPPNEAMLRGTRFHTWAENFFDVYDTVGLDQWGTLVDTTLKEDEQEYQRWFIRKERERYNKLIAAGKEDYFVPAYREVHLSSTDLKLHGYIDRIDYKDKEKKTFTLVEYKTSKKYKPADVKRELSYYRMLWDDSMSDLGTIADLLIINPECTEYQYYPVSQRNMTAAKNMMDKCRTAIAANDFPRPMNLYKCQYCKLCELYDYQTRP
jgi:RecB family exonuclease